MINGMKLTPTWQILRDEIKDAIKSYEVQFNKGKEVPVTIELQEGAKKINNPNHPDIIAMGYVRIAIKKQGNMNILINKTFGFRTKAEANKEDWKLTLYREVLYEIVGGALTFGDIIDSMRNE